MKETGHCQSCGMTIEDGTYCQYCVDERGDLQTFDERLERMSQWMLGQKQAATKDEAKQKALKYMATMPAWRDHPKVRGPQ